MATVDASDGWTVTTQEIEKVDPYDKHFAITFIQGGSIYVPNENDYPLPKPGDIATVHWYNHTGWGGRFTGVRVGEYQYMYKTRAEVDQEHADYLQDIKDRKQKEYDENIEKWLEQKNKLLPPLRQRLERFESESGTVEFWLNDGAYELFCVSQAQMLYEWSLQFDNPVEKIDEFNGLDYKKQIELVPGVDEGHSGWTFSAMIVMAKMLHEENPKL